MTYLWLTNDAMIHKYALYVLLDAESNEVMFLA